MTQEVFRAAFMGLGMFRRDGPKDSFRGWLHGITRHKLLDHWRRQARNPAPHQAGSSILNGAPEWDDESDRPEDEQNDLRSLAHRAAELVKAEFEHQTWNVFWRVMIDGEDPRDVAGDLRLSVNAVYLAKSRVLRRLREELDGSDMS